MVELFIASDEDIELLMSSRLEMLRIVNDMAQDDQFTEELVSYSRDFFLHGNQTTVLVRDGESIIGCATICYIDMMPTFSHPTGKRAHLMNVYTNNSYRRQGVALRMVNMLIQEAKEKGVTEINLDATESGRPLYYKCGFTDSEECMVLSLV